MAAPPISIGCQSVGDGLLRSSEPATSSCAVCGWSTVTRLVHTTQPGRHVAGVGEPVSRPGVGGTSTLSFSRTYRAGQIVAGADMPPCRIYHRDIDEGNAVLDAQGRVVLDWDDRGPLAPEREVAYV